MAAYLPYLLVVISFFVPLLAIFWLMVARSYDYFVWMLKVLANSTWFFAAFLAVPWAFTSIYLRYFFLLIFLFAIYYSFKKVKNKSFFKKKSFSQYLGFLYVFISLALGIILFAFVVGGFFHREQAISLQSPLKHGRYYVMQGGDSPVTNFFHYFFKRFQFRYAMDVAKLDEKGRRANGVAPENLQDYVIYGDSVYSPCNGVVVAVQDSFPDNRIGDLRFDSQAGNFVVVSCNDTFVILAHLQLGSIAVAVGDTVEAGRLFGRVGNSGYSMEPHLHMQAFVVGRNGQERSVPILINGRFLSINQRFSGE